jgi:hypothetical protein
LSCHRHPLQCLFGSAHLFYASDSHSLGTWHHSSLPLDAMARDLIYSRSPWNCMVCSGHYLCGLFLSLAALSWVRCGCIPWAVTSEHTLRLGGADCKFFHGPRNSNMCYSCKTLDIPLFNYFSMFDTYRLFIYFFYKSKLLVVRNGDNEEDWMSSSLLGCARYYSQLHL